MVDYIIIPQICCICQNFRFLKLSRKQKCILWIYIFEFLIWNFDWILIKLDFGSLSLHSILCFFSSRFQAFIIYFAKIQIFVGAFQWRPRLLKWFILHEISENSGHFWNLFFSYSNIRIPAIIFKYSLYTPSF